MRVCIALMAVMFLLGFPAFSKVDPGELGVNYNCIFPITVKLDGDFSDWPAFVSWHTVPHDMGTAPAPDDADASYSFAVVADESWLYIAFKVKDDKIQSGEDTGCNVWKDDSVEVYIDAGHGEETSYGPDDSQITIGADNIGGDIENPKLGGCVGTAQGPQLGVKAAVVETADGWAVEAAIPLKNKFWEVVPKDGLVIGFNTHMNDDDDGGGRDHKLIWSKKDTADTSWKDPSVFADLTFVSITTAASPKGKLATSWGRLKSR